MRIQIDAQPIGPLKVLPNLPEARLALLEGLNGIGKTLAVRILQLCAGTLPYDRDSAAWTSLCKGLGEFHVIIEGLEGATEIRWSGDSRDWVDLEPRSYPAFRSISIDGHTAVLDDVRPLLAVHRVGGDEGIIETFAQQAEAAGETVRRWMSRHTAEQSSPLARLESVVADALQVLGDWTAVRLRQLETQAQDAELGRRDAATKAEVEAQKRDRLADLAQMRTELAEIRATAPDLLVRLEEIDAAIAKIQGDRDRLHREITQLAARVAGERSILKELKNARRTLERNQAELSKSLNIAAVLAAGLDVEPTIGAVSAALAALQEQLSELTEEQTRLDSAPEMRQLLTGITTDLVAAEKRGFADQIAIDDPETDLELTVSQTRIGMEARRSYLEGQPPPPQARNVADQLATVSASIRQTNQLQSVVADQMRRRRLVRENEERVDRALTATDPKAGSRLQALEVERREKDERLLGLAAERASLRQQLGTFGSGDTEQQLEMRLQVGADDLGVSLEELGAALADAVRDANEAQVRLAAAEEYNVASRREVARAGAEIRRVSATVAGSDDWAWVRAAVPHAAIPDAELLPSQQAQSLDVLRGRLSGITERLGAHRIQIGGVGNALRAVARHIRGQDPQAVEYVAELQGWLGRKFTDWFNSERVRSELLPEADGLVTVDLKNRDVEWTLRGAQRSRPLEAFSSGEQAFAYTRARLAVLDEEQPRPANRLVVLDEFGAFIAHDRLAGLLAYLRDRATHHPEDQVLVVLPLTNDYRQMSENAVGAEHDRLLKLAEEIATRSFAVQVLPS